jgi:TPR repeat protein
MHHSQSAREPVTMQVSDDFPLRAVEQIDDFAVDPEGWTDTLTRILGRRDLACLSWHVMRTPRTYLRQRFCPGWLGNRIGMGLRRVALVANSSRSPSSRIEVRTMRHDRLTLSTALAVLLAMLLAHPYPALADERLACAGAAASPFQPGFEAVGKSQEQIDADQAIALCRSALDADPHDPMVHAWLARAYFVAKRYEEMHPHLEIAANAGDPMGQQILGTALTAGYGIDADPQAGLLWFQQSAEHGYASARYSLGMAHLHGEGTETDPALAAHYFELAAGQGLAIAKLDLGALLLEGNGVDADPERAVTLFEEAAQAGNAQAMFNLGFLHMTGRAVEPDDTAAFQWFVEAEAAGYAPAASHLASYYVDGTVLEEDPQEAIRLATIGAEAGDAYGHYLLGYFAEYGIGGDIDTAQAIGHYQAAAELGSEEAKQALSDLAAPQ